MGAKSPKGEAGNEREARRRGRGGRGTRRCWAAAWPAASSAAAHRRGPLPQRGQPRTRPMAVPAVTPPSERDCQSRPGGPPAPGILSTRKVGRAFESRSGRRYHFGTPPPLRRDPTSRAPICSQTGVGSGWSARSRSDQGSASLPADWAGTRSPSGRGRSGGRSYDSCPLSRTSLVGVPAEKYRSSWTPYGSRYQPWARTSTLPW